MSPTRIFAVAFALVSITGCTSGATSSPRTGASVDSCNETIAAYCAERHCSSFEEALAHVRDLKNPSPERFGPWAYSVTTCGDVRVISSQEGMGSMEEAFDREGRLVAMRGNADSPTSCGSNAWSAGSAPSCDGVAPTEEASGFAEQQR